MEDHRGCTALEEGVLKTVEAAPVRFVEKNFVGRKPAGFALAVMIPYRGDRVSGRGPMEDSI
jgi:hypothetical protein